mmetsp:Transcript_11144/g.35390  ORF Transcript_11144/g.35390 Transcript_11144/m.35390 type:complete len:235 (+) Transcript_11144:239-943(+)
MGGVSRAIAVDPVAMMRRRWPGGGRSLRRVRSVLSIPALKVRRSPMARCSTIPSRSSNTRSESFSRCAASNASRTSARRASTFGPPRVMSSSELSTFVYLNLAALAAWAANADFPEPGRPYSITLRRLDFGLACPLPPPPPGEAPGPAEKPTPAPEDAFDDQEEAEAGSDGEAPLTPEAPLLLLGALPLSAPGGPALGLGRRDFFTATARRRCSSDTAGLKAMISPPPPTSDSN